MQSNCGDQIGCVLHATAVEMGKLKTALCLTSASRAKEKKLKSSLARDLPPKPKIQIPHHIFSDGTRSLYPFKEDSAVLVIGDGDLSYSCALAAIFGKSINLVATVYENEDLVCEKYASARQNIEFLRKIESCTLLFEVDGTNLKKTPSIKENRFDRIIFNFPHCGKGIKDQRRNIQENQKLMAEFFKSAKYFLKSQLKDTENNRSKLPSYHTCLHPIKEISEDSLVEFQDYLLNKADPLANKSQGANTDEEDAGEDDKESSICQFSDFKHGPSEIHITLKEGEPYDSWKIKELAASAGLCCKESFKFYFEKYTKYQHKRSIGDILNMELDQKDHVTENKRLKTWVFVEAPPKSSLKALKK